MKTYEQMHSGLHWARGRASEYQCDCGKPAVDWAYQYTGVMVVGENGRRYSESFDDYAAMCRGCHRKFDQQHDPVWRQKLGLFTATQAAQNPEFRAELGRRAERGRATIKRLLEEGDPALTKIRYESGKRLSAVRRRCNQCGMVSTRGPLGQHQHFTGHVGFEDVS